MLFGNIKLLHSGHNRNHSNVTEDAAKNCMSTIAYKPILANFTDVNGELDFTSHDFIINDDDTVTYFEKQVGCFTADKPYMEQDPDREDRKYVFAKCAIPRQYTAAADIIERKGGTKISAELGINKMSYDSKEKELLFEDIVVLGATLLGVDPETGEEIGEGMEGARLDIADFSVENNSIINNKQDLINEITDAVFQRLDDKLAELSPNNFREGGKVVMDNENVNVEFEETEAEENEVDNTEEMEEVTVDETTTGEETQVVETEASGEDSDDTAETPEVVENESVEDQKKTEFDDGKRTFNINGANFEVSLSEIQWSLYELVNESYSESDNDYYSVEVYEGSKTVVMTGWFSCKSYRQSYKVRNSVYSLVGDRVPVKAVYVTSDEEAELDKMRANYSVISDKLVKYESEPEKMEVLNSSDYANIADQSDFKELKKQENHFDLTVDELKGKADAMLLQFAKSGKINFAATETEEKKTPKKDFFAFARSEGNSSFLDGLLNKR